MRVVANFAATAANGKKYHVDYYNLDVVISVGYRVKSQRGVQFRLWASRVLKEFIRKGFALDDERLKGNAGGNYWSDYIRQLDSILTSGGRALLSGAGTISRAEALEKAHAEYHKYQQKTLSPVEKAYFQSLKEAEKEVKVETRKGKKQQSV